MKTYTWLYIDEDGTAAVDEFDAIHAPEPEDETGSRCAAPLFICGSNYAERKACAADVAAAVQDVFSGCSVYASTFAAVTSWLETVGRRYGLLREFRENCII